jgi:hypothetical protein
VPLSDALRLEVVLPQHADEHRPERPVLLAIDQEFGATATPTPRAQTDPIGGLLPSRPTGLGKPCGVRSWSWRATESLT